METQELFYPEVRAMIGKYIFHEGIGLRLYSDKKSAYDWSAITFTKEFQEQIMLSAMDKAEIYLGYAGKLEKVFSGYVTKKYNAASEADQILLKDETLKLGNTYITNTFLSATPQEIARYAFSQAGITKMELPQQSYPQKSVVPIIKKSVLSVLKELQGLWDMGDLPVCIRNGIAYWGIVPPQEKQYQFVYGENIISLARNNGYWVLETVSIPYVRHSDQICVSHPKVNGSFEVQKMLFSTENGFIRTKIYF